jgi:hypothetical protein
VKPPTPEVPAVAQAQAAAPQAQAVAHSGKGSPKAGRHGKMVGNGLAALAMIHLDAEEESDQSDGDGRSFDLSRPNPNGEQRLVH